MINITNSLSGRFMLQTAKVDSNGKEIPGTRKTVAPWQDNLITDTGMDRLGTDSPNGFLDYLSVGSGATPPQFTDSTLQARVATVSGVSPTNGYKTTAPYFTWARREYQFAAGAAAGNLSEIGLTNNSGSQAYTRALIKDSSGNPTTITILADELLIATYELRVYCHTEDIVTTATIKGAVTTITIRPANLGASSGHQPLNSILWTGSVGTWYTGGSGVGPVTGTPSGAGSTYNSQGGSVTTAPYVNGTHYRDQTMNLGVQAAAGLVLTGFKGTSAPTNYQIGFQPGVPKTNAETVALRLRMSWARYTP